MTKVATERTWLNNTALNDNFLTIKISIVVNQIPLNKAKKVTGIVERKSYQIVFFVSLGLSGTQ